MKIAMNIIFKSCRLILILLFVEQSVAQSVEGNLGYFSGVDFQQDERSERVNNILTRRSFSVSIFSKGFIETSAQSRKGITLWINSISTDQKNGTTSLFHMRSLLFRYQRRYGPVTRVISLVDIGLGVSFFEEEGIYDTNWPAIYFKTNGVLNLGIISTIIPLYEKIGLVFNLHKSFLFGSKLDRYPYTSGFIFTVGVCFEENKKKSKESP